MKFKTFSDYINSKKIFEGDEEPKDPGAFDFLKCKEIYGENITMAEALKKHKEAVEKYIEKKGTKRDVDEKKCTVGGETLDISLDDYDKIREKIQEIATSDGDNKPASFDDLIAKAKELKIKIGENDVSPEILEKIAKANYKNKGEGEFEAKPTEAEKAYKDDNGTFAELERKGKQQIAALDNAYKTCVENNTPSKFNKIVAQKDAKNDYENVLNNINKNAEKDEDKYVVKINESTGEPQIFKKSGGEAIDINEIGDDDPLKEVADKLKDIKRKQDLEIRLAVHADAKNKVMNSEKGEQYLHALANGDKNKIRELKAEIENDAKEIYNSEFPDENVPGLTDAGLVDALNKKISQNRAADKNDEIQQTNHEAILAQAKKDKESAKKAFERIKADASTTVLDDIPVFDSDGNRVKVTLNDIEVDEDGKVKLTTEFTDANKNLKTTGLEDYTASKAISKGYAEIQKSKQDAIHAQLELQKAEINDEIARNADKAVIDKQKQQLAAWNALSDDQRAKLSTDPSSLSKENFPDLYNDKGELMPEYTGLDKQVSDLDKEIKKIEKDVSNKEKFDKNVDDLRKAFKDAGLSDGEIEKFVSSPEGKEWVTNHKATDLGEPDKNKSIVNNKIFQKYKKNKEVANAESEAAANEESNNKAVEKYKKSVQKMSDNVNKELEKGQYGKAAVLMIAKLFLQEPELKDVPDVEGLKNDQDKAEGYQAVVESLKANKDVWNELPDSVTGALGKIDWTNTEDALQRIEKLKDNKDFKKVFDEAIKDKELVGKLSDGAKDAIRTVDEEYDRDEMISDYLDKKKDEFKDIEGFEEGKSLSEQSPEVQAEIKKKFKKIEKKDDFKEWQNKWENDDTKDENDNDDIEDDEEYNPDNEDEEGSDTNYNKNRVNPRKVWKRRKLKGGRGLSKSYKKKNKEGKWDSISRKEYKEKCKAYDEWAKKTGKGKMHNESLEVLPGINSKVGRYIYEHMKTFKDYIAS